MPTSRRFASALTLLSAVALSACICNADEERAVTVSAPDSLTVTPSGGAARKVEIVTRLTQFDLPGSTFAYVFNSIETAAGGEGIALTLSGRDATTDELVLLVLGLPASLRRGDTYQVGGTFRVDAGVPSDPRLWGPRDLAASDRAEIAFTTARYTFPPAAYTSTFQATGASGTVRITNRQRGWVEMQLDITATDGTGATRRITGRAQANSERYTPPCT
jgi:hypothetical protein